MRRTAFVGLSGPLAYDYKAVERGREPTPILEGALGLLLCYDEIVFLTPGLCPPNMRNLDYVSFLSDRDDFAEAMHKVRSVSEIASSSLYEPPADAPSPMEMYAAAVSAVTGQGRVMKSADVRYATDYHAMVATGKGPSLPGRSADLRTVIADWEILSAFGLEHCDPVFNSASSICYAQMRNASQPLGAASIADHLVVSRLPDYLGPSGPYHPCIEDLRQSDFLCAFRDKLDEYVALPSAAVKEVVKEMEAKVGEYERDVLVEYLSSGRNRYVSLAKAAIMDTIGLCVPGLGMVSALAGEYFKARRIKAMKWAGFVAQLDARRGE